MNERTIRSDTRGDPAEKVMTKKGKRLRERLGAQAVTRARANAEAGKATTANWELIALTEGTPNTPLADQAVRRPELSVRLLAALNPNLDERNLNELRKDPEPIVRWAARRCVGSEPDWTTLAWAVAQQVDAVLYSPCDPGADRSPAEGPAHVASQEP